MLSVVVTLITLSSLGMLLCFRGKKSLYPVVYIGKKLLALLDEDFLYINVFIILSTSLAGASILGTIAIFLYHNFNDLTSYIYVDGFVSTALHLTKYLIYIYDMNNDVTQVIVKLVLFIIGVMTQFINERDAEYQ
ncbi:hypothetical protein AN2V17_14190 [Vallitalea sp. AN17-2]|uniref:Uncharacterized protein n=2 Tax=Vallitalea maricola TaxID=3074433 RepID=A0ACB5UJU5_9FIRM|nr:hypothetical protein AN2V17_14190 [Vallitalea sp. AN17-2]